MAPFLVFSTVSVNRPNSLVPGDVIVPELLLQSKPDRICVMRLSAIGDTCHALAVIRRLQDNWPDAHITWIIGKTEASLMADIPDIRFVIFDKARGRAAYRDVRNALRGQRFDVALCMHASLRANLLIRSLPADIRLGFDRARAKDLQWLFTNRRIDAAQGEHAMEAMMAFATAIGADSKALRWDIPIAAADQSFADGYRAPGKRLVVISACSSQRARNYRDWRIENYAAVISHLESEHDARVLLTGGPTAKEKDYGAALSEASRADNLVGQSTLQQLAALIRTADLVICPDSGPAHMATALGTPVIGLYATSNPDRTGPYNSRKYTINRYPDAIRTYLGKNVDAVHWGQRVRHPDAMDLIQLSDVIEKVDLFFDDRAN
ncbi:MAG: lipopolysaccharide heptosyltransferase family protein [Chromatiales bacterium]|nr:MAG: lipopolysaccharide heptosyltransferase family protein [Chromatiales bacterium]